MELMHPGDEEVPEVHRRTAFDRVSRDVQRGAYLVHEDGRPALSEWALVGSVMAALVQGAAALEHVLDIINIRHTGEERAVTREQPAAGTDWLSLPIVESRAGFSLGTFLGEVTGAEADVALDLLVAMAGLLAHFCLTNALAIAPATVVVPLDFARLPVIAIVGMLLYNEALDFWVFVGATIIFAGNYFNIWMETRRR